MRVTTKLFVLSAAIGLLTGCQDHITDPSPIPSSAVETVREFNAAQGQHPENVAVDRRGTVYVTLHESATVWKRDAAGQEWFINVPGSNPTGSQTRANGLVIDRVQNALILVRSDLPELAGIWQISPAKAVTKLIALPAKAGLNGLAQDEVGNLYATDDANGLVYRIKAGQITPDVWASGSLLKPQGQSASGFPVFGVNGIKVYKGAVFVSNPSQSSILRIPIQVDGAARPITEAYPGKQFANVDDITFDEQGNLYTTTVDQNTVNQISPTGQSRVLLTQADGLDQPTAVAFGTAAGDATKLYITNASFYTPPGQTSRASLLRTDISIKGTR
ncbi:SMP-30/gluconolactonase/LRE family protein [Spirosoma arcticum]